MKIFVAGASGVIGRSLVPMLVAAGHEVAGTTRSAERAEAVRGLGAEPVVVDVFDAAALRDAVVEFDTELVMHQLTDLPDDAAKIPEHFEANARIRKEGTANLIAAARAANADRLLAQSIAWVPDGPDTRGVLEDQVLDFGGVVLRYGQLYGPGTYYEDGPPPDPPRIEIEAAARRTLDLLDAPSGIVEIVE